MKLLLLKSAMLFLFCGTMFSQTALQQVRHYTWPLKSTTTYDSVLVGLEGIRAIAVEDLNGDGKVEFVVTNYLDQGHVHVFTPAGKDTFELAWSSPRVDSNGGYSSPRNVVIGDLDNDGRKEIIFENRGNGVFIYEWDGNAGLNFGTKYSQVINSGTTGFPPSTGNSYAEKMTVIDVDKDGQQELVFAYRIALAAEQKYMIIRALGTWETNEPGFSSFELVYMAARPNLLKWGLNGGAIGMMPANLDGVGPLEVVIQAYNSNATTILRNEGGVWKLADTTNDKHFVFLSPNDGVSYFGGLTYDIDKDGRDEVYMPTNITTAPDPPALVRGIYYNAGSSITEIDTVSNVFALDFFDMVGAAGIWGYGYGDIDGNGKPNLYFSTAKLGAAIITAEFQGGNKADSANWKKSVLWRGDTTFHSVVIKDSLGKIDTVSYENEFLFPSKIFAKKTDIDNNGREEIITGFQPWYSGSGTTSTVSVTKYTWNAANTKFDTTTFSETNKKRLGFVVLEKSLSTGINEKQLTFITPEDYQLNQNYPNPFNPSTTINFVLPLTKKVTVKVYDMIGKEVATLVNGEEYAKGSHNVVWNGRDKTGKTVASGAYIAKMSAGNVEKTIKMMMLK